ncbi:bifunctional diguanylate cyclase/phosphodiesterase [Luteimonas suaedae]|uniref:bifunctional diguanylate cyclase/phosphodiesterase n=1 Tax=Luteimonas suaedae TaxID=2605430 RepID=UPI0011EBE7F8|nr:EAL domain-containing protein [Luteimonas suaedae]
MIGLSGLLLGTALTAVLIYLVLHDRAVRLRAAEDQSRAVVTGVERLLKYRFRNLERAMLGIAGDGERLFASVPEQAPGLLSEAIAGVLRRHEELESIVLVDRDGRAITRGRGDPAFPAWIGEAPTGRNSALRLGPMQRDGEGGWLLPMALQASGRHWILARLRSGALQEAVSDLDTGRRGIAVVTDRNGHIMARSPDPQRFVGQYERGLDVSRIPARGETLRTRSPLDDNRHIIFSRHASAVYPTVVSAGISEEEVLAPWRWFAGWALLLYAAYWAGFWYLLRNLRRAESTRSALMQELRQGAERLRTAQRLGRTGVWESVDGSDLIEWSPQVGEIFGMPEGSHSASREAFYAAMHPEDREEVSATVARAWQTGEKFILEYRILRPDGQMRWIAVRGATVEDRDGVSKMGGTVVDITERMEAQQKLADAERQFRLMFERNPLPFWVFDVDTLRFLEVNEAAVRHYGYSREEFLSMSILDIRPADAADEVRRDVAERNADYADARVWIHRKRDGALIEVQVHGAAIEFRGRPARLVLAEDVTRRVAHERELAFRASHDSETGLLTATTLAERLDGGTGGYDIVCAELRGLDLIGDTLGREVSGDIVRNVAERIDRLARRYGLAAHLPSGTFVLAVLDGRRSETVLSALVADLAEPVHGRDTVHHLEARIGIARHPDDGRRASKVIDRAALAAHLVERGGIEVARYSATMEEDVQRRLELTARTRRAIEQGEFRLDFQPIRRVADGAPVALEALLRWPQPDGSEISPLEFIPLCERSGLIVTLGKWVLDEAARAAAHVAERGWDELPIAVNVSAAQFHMRDLAGDIQHLSDRYGLRRGALHVELTESVLLDHAGHAMDRLRQLRQQGVCVALDDFGTGFSNMSYLRDLPLDMLKLDRMFVESVNHNSRSAAICRALIALGHAVDLTVIAEGVEHADQHAWLRDHGCDQMQGYLFDRPGSLDVTLAALARPIDKPS